MSRHATSILFVILLTASSASGAPRRVTYFGSNLLSRCDLVVRATVARRTLLPGGITLTTLQVRETLYGKDPGGRLALTSPDPLYHGDAGQQIVAFLAKDEDGRAWVTVERFLIEDATGLARLRMARAYLDCEAMPDLRERVAATATLHMTNIAGADPWGRDNAIRELSWFTERWPEAFTRRDRDRLLAVRRGMPATPVREMLTQAVHRIDAALGKDREATGPIRREDPEKRYRESLEMVRKSAAVTDRAGRLAALARSRPARVRPDLAPFLDDPAPEVRRVAAFHIGETEYEPAAGRLLEVLARPREDIEVRRDAIRALGILRHGPAVNRLAEAVFADEGRLADAAVLGLARIGSSEAAAVLERLREQVQRDEEQVAALRRIVTFISTDAFKKQEAILARIRRQRLISDR